MKTTSTNCSKANDYFVAGIRGTDVLLGNFVSGYQVVSEPEALRMANAGLLRGYVHGKLVPCLHCGKLFNSKYYFCDGDLYRYEGGKYVSVNAIARTDTCTVYNTTDSYIVAFAGKYLCCKSSLLSKGYNFINVEAFTLKDDRVFLLAQGMRNLYYNSVQSVYNELLQVTENGLVEVYVTDDSKFEMLASMYREVSQHSTDVADIKQRIVNSQVRTELERFVFTRVGNVAILGGIEINLGGQDG